MNKSKAMALIEAAEKTPKYTNVGGFMVSFEVIKGHILASDHFPDKHAGERLFKNEDEAWLMARRFANATDDTYVNIYVIDSSFVPVKNYEFKKLKRYTV